MKFEIKHIALLITLLLALPMMAQKKLAFSVDSFEQDMMDGSAKNPEFEMRDGNGDRYAIIKVKSDNPDDDLSEYRFNFGSLNHRVQPMPNSIWLYVQKNAKTVTISRDGYVAIERYDLKTTIEAGATYVLRLSSQTAVDKVTWRVLQFKVSPKGEKTSVWVKSEAGDGDYESWGDVDENGAKSKLMQTGGYLYRILSKDYLPVEGRISLTEGGDNYVETVTLQPDFGFLEVNDDGNSRGAEVYVDDKLIGTLPLRSDKRWEPRGDYRLRISNGELYKPYSETFAIRRGETTVITPSFTADFANVTISVEGGADIYVDGNRKGAGSWSGPLKYGTHQVECRKDKHHSTQKNISVYAEGTTTFTMAAPEAMTGQLYVNSTPSDAQITIDGKQSGVSPKLFNDLLIGDYTITLKANGYKTAKYEITLKEGEINEITAELEKGSDVPPGAYTLNGKMYIPKDVKRFNINGVIFDMIKVKKGSYVNSEGKDVRIKKDFYIAQTELTQELWSMLSGTQERFWLSREQGNDYPACYIDYDNALAFVKVLSDVTHFEFRLPSCEEWEFAARGGINSHNYKYSGSDIIDNVAWYSDNASQKLHEVKTKMPNELGLFDMTGNVCEWCMDNKIKGGGYYHDKNCSFVSLTENRSTGTPRTHIGFRIVMSASKIVDKMPQEIIISSNVQSSMLSTIDKTLISEVDGVDGRIYGTIEEMPEFPGGQSALNQYVSSNVKYPVVAQENGVQGRVNVGFVVGKDGSIKDVKVVKSVDPSLDREAERVVKNMPKWIPGTQNGQAVSVKYNTSVSFKLQ